MIVEGSPATVELYERAVRRFRATGGHPAFLERPDTVVPMAVDADEAVGWCWGTSSPLRTTRR